jgi:hypothetical protein
MRKAREEAGNLRKTSREGYLQRFRKYGKLTYYHKNREMIPG